jgi:alpha-amylase/alpha-mannosidase (GH57 family)
MADRHFALVLNLHQPAGNLQELLERREWEAREILWAMDRIPRSLWPDADIGRLHVSISGTLLETLADPDFQSRVYGIVDCGSLLWYLQNQRIVNVLGTAYYHPVLPLIPRLDWDAQIERWRGIGKHLFARDDFAGFWPPEMGFSMELIPSLRRAGYQYVVVDSDYVQPLTPMRWDELRYRPHIARHDGEEIVVVVRDRELSDAQLAGMQPDWFVAEVDQRTRHCDYPALVTTCTDGENGGWFRNQATAANFWGCFYRPFLDRVRAGQSAGIQPTFIDDYLRQYGAHGEVKVHPGAWNTGWHVGTGFVQWTGSATQRDALTRLHQTSQAVNAVRSGAAASPTRSAETDRLLEEAYWHVLRAETSCNFFWGESWVQRCHDDLDQAALFLQMAKQ